MAVRSLARYLSLCLPQNVLEMVNVPRKWYDIHRLRSESLLDYSEIYENEINTLFTKMAFLTLVKFSNHNFPPNSTGFQHENIAGIFFVKSRDLLYRAFQNAHVVKIPAQQLENNTTAHLSVSLAAQLMRTGFSVPCLILSLLKAGFQSLQPSLFLLYCGMVNPAWGKSDLRSTKNVSLNLTQTSATCEKIMSSNHIFHWCMKILLR